uniref:Putative secreted protein n=1 Tax=Anopheles darlingi TaxID=43151 RepID=A0A2M4DC73_ANODA
MKKFKLFLTLLFPLFQTLLKNTLCILQSRQSHRKLQGTLLLNLRFCSPSSTRHSHYNFTFFTKTSNGKGRSTRKNSIFFSHLASMFRFPPISMHAMMWRYRGI